VHGRIKASGGATSPASSKHSTQRKEVYHMTNELVGPSASDNKTQMKTIVVRKPGTVRLTGAAYCYGCCCCVHNF
jgi:hypothetical protein